MGQKLYKRTPEGGIKFTSHRMGQVRVANYVYDIWLPILGVRGVAVYSVYCRLEREGVVKAITQVDLAKACRIGPSTLREVNEQLEECGFVKITKPEGHKRLMHWTTEIEVYDPPTEVPSEIVEKYQHPQGYEALSTWLVSPETVDHQLPSCSGETNQLLDEQLPNRSNVVSLGLHPLEVELPAASQRKTPETSEGNNGDQPVDTYLPDAKTQWDILFGPGGKRKGRSWSTPPSAGGADSLGDALLPIFCQGVDFPVEALKPKEQRQWAAELRKVAEGRGATVEQAVAALNAYFDPQGEFNWKAKSVSSPFQRGFQTDWNKLLARAVEGQPLIMTSPVPRKHKEIRYGGRSDFPD